MMNPKRSKVHLRSDSSTIMAITIPNIGKPNIRQSLYIGFIVFQRKFCGTQFLNDLVSENLKIEIFDNGKYYKIDSRIQIENGDKSVGMVFSSPQFSGVTNTL